MSAAPPSLDPPTRRQCRVEGMAMILREQTRFPTGTPRISPDKARQIAEFMYQYLVTEKVVLP